MSRIDDDNDLSVIGYLLFKRWSLKARIPFQAR